MRAEDVAQKGVGLAARELEQRGVRVAPARDGLRRNALRAVLPSGEAVDIYVKTRRAGTWQSKIYKGSPHSDTSSTDSFWLFVDLMTEPKSFYIVPARWMENDIYETHQAYLARHGGRRARTPSSTHHSIPEGRISQWRGRWDLLGLVKESA